MFSAQQRLYQAMGLPSRTNSPLSSGWGFKSKGKIPDTLSAGVRSALGPPMSVCTQPGQMECTRMSVLLNSEAKMRVTAFSPALEIR